MIVEKGEGKDVEKKKGRRNSRVCEMGINRRIPKPLLLRPYLTFDRQPGQP